MIIKSKHASNFTVIPNRILADLRDFNAIGILVYLLSKPSDWAVYKSTLYKDFNQGRKAIDKAFKLLEDKGYLIGVQQYDKEGKFSGFQWVVYDVPFNGDNRLPHKEHSVAPLPIADKPIADKEQLLNKDNTKDYNNTKEIYIPPFQEFKEYAVNKKTDVCLVDLKKKYDAWVLNDWHNGRGDKIKSWKLTLNNTLPYLKSSKPKANSNTFVNSQGQTINKSAW